MQFPFGPQLMGGPPVGPVPQIDLPSGFRPPGLMGGGAPNPMQPQGMAMGGIPYVPGLGAKKPGDWQAARTAGDRDLNGYGGSPVNADGTPVMGNPNAQPVEVFNPTGAVTAQPGQGGQSGSNFWDVFPRLFRGASGFSGPTAAFDNFRG